MQTVAQTALTTAQKAKTEGDTVQPGRADDLMRAQEAETWARRNLTVQQFNNMENILETSRQESIQARLKTYMDTLDSQSKQQVFNYLVEISKNDALRSRYDNVRLKNEADALGGDFGKYLPYFQKIFGLAGDVVGLAGAGVAAGAGAKYLLKGKTKTTQSVDKFGKWSSSQTTEE